MFLYMIWIHACVSIVTSALQVQAGRWSRSQQQELWQRSRITTLQLIYQRVTRRRLYQGDTRRLPLENELAVAARPIERTLQAAAIYMCMTHADYHFWITDAEISLRLYKPNLMSRTLSRYIIISTYIRACLLQCTTKLYILHLCVCL